MTAEPRATTELPHNEALDISEVEPYRRLLADAVREGEAWRRHCAEVEEYEYPRRGRWLRGDTESVADHKPYSDRLLNNATLNARRVVASSLQTGLTPSSREWFEIRPDDEELRDNANVTWYLSKLKKKALRILSGSNFYSEINGVYEDACAFNTSAMLMEDDDETVLNFMRLPVGSFWPAIDAKSRVNGLFRRYALSAENMAKEFGLDQCPAQVRERLREGHYYERTTIIQAILPVHPGDPNAPEWAEYESVYFTEAKREGEDAVLARRHYRAKPFIVFRWSVDDGSPYGMRCPGMDSLGDSRQLQAMERKKLRAIDVAIDPPMVAPRTLFGKLNRRPGTVTWTEGESGADSLRPLTNVQYNIGQVREEIAQAEKRIADAHFNSYFVSMLGVTKQMTAEEARQRAEEKMMILGPVVERFQFDLLDTVLDRNIDAIMFHKLAPPLPPEIADGFIKYSYSGPLALIQQLVELGNIERWLNVVSVMAANLQKVDALDRVDGDEVAEVSAKILAIDPALITSLQDAQKLRQARAQQAEQAAGAENAMNMAQGAETLSRAEMGGGNALEVMLGMGAGGPA